MNNTFGEMFQQFRSASGFSTMNQFGQALAEEGYVYEDSIFSKWKSGERVPRERKLVFALIKVFAKYNKAFSLEDANSLLECLDLRQLNPVEIAEVFADTTWVIDEKDYYSTYRKLNEPNVLFQNLQITEDNLRVFVLEEIENVDRKKYWTYQVRCAVADYYSKLSDGKKTPEEVFRTLAWDYYNHEHRTYTVLITVNDDVGSDEYLALTLRCVIGSNKDNRILEILDLFGCEGEWPHKKVSIPIEEIAELSRFVIPNWGWQYNEMLTKIGFWTLVRYAQQQGIRFFYAIVSDYVTHVLDAAGIVSKPVEHAYALHTQPQAKEKFPIAYEDAQDYALFWQRFKPKVCYFEV